MVNATPRPFYPRETPGTHYMVYILYMLASDGGTLQETQVQCKGTTRLLDNVLIVLLYHNTKYSYKPWKTFKVVPNISYGSRLTWGKGGNITRVHQRALIRTVSRRAAVNTSPLLTNLFPRNACF